MAIALVGTPGSAQAFGTTATVTRTSTAGNTLVVFVQHQGNTSATITDNTGATWTLAETTNTAGATSQRLASIYYRLNAASVTSVTATMSASSALNLLVAEFSGVGSYRAAVTTNLTTGTTTYPVTATVGDLVVGLVAWTAASRAESLSAGFTALPAVTTSTTYLAGAYLLAATGSPSGPTWTGVNATAGLITAAFAPTASALTGSCAVVPTSGTAPLAVTATITTSGGTGTAKNYTFAWGDGVTTGPQTGASASHTYASAGSFDLNWTAVNT